MNSLLGTGALIRLALRRDRILLPAWILAFVVLAATSAAATIDLYPTTASVVQAANALNDTPAMVALYGRVHDPASVGALAMLKALATGALLLAVLAVVLVVRHTRAEEESGRLELVGSGVVGRFAPLTAALAVVLGANILLGLITAVAVQAVGLPAGGAFVFGLAWAAVATAFAAVAAVTAQLVSSRRAAIGLAVAVLGVVYAVRAVGDTAPEDGPRWLSWLSPIGWGQQFRPFAGDRWWVVLLTLGFAAAMTAVAYVLAARRDLGAGVLAERPGPTEPGRWLRGPLTLAWRLQRGTLLGWTAGFVGYGLLVGSVADSAADMLNSDQARELFAQLGGEAALTDTVLAAMLGVLGIIASAYGVQAGARLHAEEVEHRAELVLAAPVSRPRWAASHLVIALAGTTVLLVAAGVAAAAAHSAQLGEPAQFGRVLAGALVQVPAAWVLTGLAMAAYGLTPRLAAAGWVALVAFMLLGDLGPVLGVDQWLMDLSPFVHVPKLPGGAFTWVPIAGLLTAAAAAITVGLVGLRRRDID
ncbi:ABC transporter permease [Actinokineospora sp. HUAS TT18]|uniref:ABC transporter permease n=1 Tax=Actinokineospora sp. HUAS TT18 TaxID=3447451 RepID=UPI003F51D308